MAAEDGDVGGDGSGSLDPFWEWFLLDGDRLLVMGAVVIVLFTFFAVLSVSGLVPLQNLQPLYYVYSGLISGNLTLITVVVAINQLLLSREFHTPSELETQIEGVVDYRSDLEEMTGQIAPVEPPGFLRVLVESTRKQAQELGGLAINEANDDVRDELDPMVAELTTQFDHVDDLLQEPGTSTFEALAATLTTNYAPQINRLRRVENQYADELPDDVGDAIEDLVHRLKDIDIARQYFKTIYLQEELATLSRHLFYVGIVSLVVVVSGLLILTASPGVSVPTPLLSLLVPGIITVGLSPLSLLFAFIVRLATVIQRTTSTIPFTTSMQER